MTAKNLKPLRVVFMGTPDFALLGLDRLAQAKDFEIVGLFTQTDKPVGRKQILTPPPAKVMAKKYGFKVFQPEKIRTEVAAIAALKPDLIVVIAYGKIIPQSILNIPLYGCINVHASLLPKYRGAACLNAPILNGDSETGVTIMKMDAGLDTGPILRQAEIKLNGTETLEEVHDRLSELGAEILLPTLRDWVAGQIIPQSQDETRATYVKTLSKEDGQIDWNKPAEEIERIIRAYNPWPGAFFLSEGKMIKIIEVENTVLLSQNHKPGEMFLSDRKLAIQCGQDALLILRLQAAGKKALSAQEYLSGHKV